MCEAVDRASRHLTRVENLSLYLGDRLYWLRDPEGARNNATLLASHAQAARSALTHDLLNVILEAKRATAAARRH